MNNSILQCLNQVATYLKVQGAKIIIDRDSVATCTYKNIKTVGALNIILFLLKATKSDLYAQTVAERPLVYQWFEYALFYCTSINSQLVAKELNDYFRNRTFLINDSLSIADILLYYAIYNIMESLSYLDKEKFVHLSRWFDNVQQDKQLRQKNKIVDFSTTYLVGLAPARH